MTHMAHTAAVAAADAAGLTSAAFYVDVASAFAEVERYLVVDDFASKEVLFKALTEYGLSEELAANVVAEVAVANMWSENGTSEHLEAMIAATLARAFATFEGTSGGACMRRGTGAGNPLADVVFLIAFAVVIRRLRQALKHAGLETSFSIQGACDFLGAVMDSHNDRVGIEDASYADDLVFLLVCQAADAFSSIQRAGAIVWQTYLECGFRINSGQKRLR